MFLAKILAAIGLLAIAGAVGIGLGKLEEKFERMKLVENMENEYKKSQKYRKNGSIFK